MGERPRFRLPAIAGFRRQLRFAGRAALRKQALAAEAVLFEIARNRVYPASWVVWRITGFRPETDQLSEAVLDGGDLRHDLAVFIQELAAELNFKCSDRPGGAVDSGEAASRLGVTVRTLQRWRAYGLPLIPIRFADGRRRKGCFLDTLERFAAVEAPLVNRARRFGRVGKAERAQIRTQVSSEIAAGQPRTVAARKVARNFGRSSGAVQRAAELEGRRTPLPRKVDELILRAYRRRISEEQLAERLGRSPATIRARLHLARRQRLEILKPGVVELSTAKLPGAEEIFTSAGELDGRIDQVLATEASAWLSAVREIGRGENADAVANRIAAMHFLHGRAARAIENLPPRAGDRLLDPVERDLAWGGRLLERTVIGVMDAAVRRYEQSTDVRLEARSTEEIVPIIEWLLERTAAVVRGFDPTRRGTLNRLERAVGLEVARAVASDSESQNSQGGGIRAVDSLRMLPAPLRSMLQPVRWWRKGGGRSLDAEASRLIEIRHGLGSSTRPHTLREMARLLGAPPTRLSGPLLAAERQLGSAGRLI